MKWLILILMCCSCDPPSIAPDGHVRNISEVSYLEGIQRIVYLKDMQTGLCFASTSLTGNDKNLTNVPCTPEVEKLIIK